MKHKKIDALTETGQSGFMKNTTSIALNPNWSIHKNPDALLIQPSNHIRKQQKLNPHS